MVSNDDIKKIVGVHRDVFATREDFEQFKKEMRKNFSYLQTAVDAYAKKADAYFQ